MATALAGFMQERGLTQAELASRTKLGRSTINNYLKGRNGASARNRKLIAEALNISPDQLLMPYTLQPGSSVAHESEYGYIRGPYGQQQREEVELRYVPYTAYGSFVSGCQDRHLGHEFEKRHIQRVAGKDYSNAYLMDIRGNSMAPRYPDGSRYIIRTVSDGNWQYATGVHAISLKGDGESMFVIKRIRSNKNGLLLLTSDNNDEEMTVQLGDINCMWKVGEADYMPEES